MINAGEQNWKLAAYHTWFSNGSSQNWHWLVEVYVLYLKYTEPTFWRVIMSSFTNFDVLCNLDECGRIDSLGMFPLLFNNKADILVLKHSFTFWQLIRQGSCPKCWRTANATPISKCAPSPSVSNYLPIYITPLLSKLLEIFIYPTKKILWEGNDFHC